jgi:hypothetical protein
MLPEKLSFHSQKYFFPLNYITTLPTARPHAVNGGDLKGSGCGVI